MAAQPPLDTQQFPETAAFLKWYEARKAAGLVDVKFCPANVEDATSESFFGEVNKAINAETIDDPEFF
jgi:hypothetical protein